MLGASVSTALALAAGLSGVVALDKITRSGRYLYDASGNRFYIKGVGYQPQGGGSVGAFGEPTSFLDPLSSGANCTRDVPVLQELGVNTVRVYSVDSSENHDDCMKALSGANIYVILDLSTPQQSITRDNPAWSTNLLDTYLRTVDAFDHYDNILAYNVGNEIVTAPNATGTAAFIKAAARDVKAYLKSKSSTTLVGYAAVDGTPTWRDPLANYMSCDPSGQDNGDTAIDLYGLNNYEFKGTGDASNAYTGTTGDYAGYNVVAYFSEFGDKDAGQDRTFPEVQRLFSSDLIPVWSGGVAFNYFPAQSAAGQFGIVSISDDGKTVNLSDEFNSLKDQYSKASPSNSPSKSDAGSGSYPACPSNNDTFLASTDLPPTPSDSACSCFASALPCQFKPKTTDETKILESVGTLLDTGCQLLGSKGGSCNDISGSGSKGVYGNVSTCDAPTKASYVFSLWWELSNKDAQACNFDGNAQLVHSGNSIQSAATCLASASGTSVPSSPASASGGSTPTSSSGSGGSDSDSSDSPSSGDNSAVALSSGSRGAVAALALAFAAGVITLA